MYNFMDAFAKFEKNRRSKLFKRSIEKINQELNFLELRNQTLNKKIEELEKKIENCIPGQWIEARLQALEHTDALIRNTYLKDINWRLDKLEKGINNG